MRSLALAAALAVVGADPLAAEALTPAIAKLAALGLKPSRIVSQKAGPATLHAVIFHDANLEVDELHVYTELTGKTALAYTHPATAERLTLHESIQPGRFPELLGAGAMTLPYYSEAPGLGTRTLHILLYVNGQVRQAGEFQEGRIEDLASTRIFVARRLPLGRFLPAGCESLDAMTKTSYRTEVYTWKKGRFVEVSSSHRKIYQRQIAQTEKSLLQKQKLPGQHLGLEISLYYDHTALGEREAGWRRLSSALTPQTIKPGAAACGRTVKDALRRKLSIPAGWL